MGGGYFGAVYFGQYSRTLGGAARQVATMIARRGVSALSAAHGLGRMIARRGVAVFTAKR